MSVSNWPCVGASCWLGADRLTSCPPDSSSVLQKSSRHCGERGGREGGREREREWEVGRPKRENKSEKGSGRPRESVLLGPSWPGKLWLLVWTELWFGEDECV